MKRNWELDELVEHFTIHRTRLRLIENKIGETRKEKSNSGFPIA